MIAELYLLLGLYLGGALIFAFSFVKGFIKVTPNKVIYKIIACLIWFIPATKILINELF